MTQVRFGIVGTGMIANALADAIAQSELAILGAVSSRNMENARKFVSKRPNVTPIEGVDSLIARSDIDALYIATPTSAKEQIALHAIGAGKHVIVEKPFVSRESVARMTSAAAARGVAFMDATHFVHHPRTAAIQSSIPARIGSPQSLHTSLYFPFSTRDNIRFDPAQEPMGMLGDLGWYSARAIVEYLRPQGRITNATTCTQIDEPTGAVIRACGMLAFESGEGSTFDVGVTAGTVLMDLQLLGTTGVISLDDFVLDWTNSWSFRHPDIKTGYTHRTAAATPKDFAFIKTHATKRQEIQMIDTFAQIVASRDTLIAETHASASRKTQEYLDAMWAAARSQ